MRHDGVLPSLRSEFFWRYAILALCSPEECQVYMTTDYWRFAVRASWRSAVPELIIKVKMTKKLKTIDQIVELLFRDVWTTFGTT